MKVGIDLGGTKIEAVVLDDDNHILLRERMPTPQGDYAATLAIIISLVRRVESEFGAFPRLGIGIPGAVSKQTGRIKNANSTCLIGRDLAADLSATLSQTIVLANDANCLALSEASDGAAAGEDVVFAVILGTGCGGGLVVNGQVLNGVNAIAGEWGITRYRGLRKRMKCIRVIAVKRVVWKRFCRGRVWRCILKNVTDGR